MGIHKTLLRRRQLPHTVCTFRWEKGPRKGKRCKNWRRHGSERCGAHDSAWRKKQTKKRRQVPKLTDVLKKCNQAQREADKVHAAHYKRVYEMIRWLSEGVAAGHITRERAFDLAEEKR